MDNLPKNIETPIKREARSHKVSYKLVLVTMGFFWFMLSIGGPIAVYIFKGVMGGGLEQDFLYPIYFGIVMLSGLIVFCTCFIAESIADLRDSYKRKESQDEV